MYKTEKLKKNVKNKQKMFFKNVINIYCPRFYGRVRYLLSFLKI